jgi:hypothetical protein
MLKELLFIAGLSQIMLVLGSLAIPKLLNWKQELSKLNPLIKQMFWTYAGYILVTNLSFGIVSIVAVDELMNGSTLARAISLFISLYWIARIIIQFFYFDRYAAPKGSIYLWGEIALVTLFVYLSVVYSYLFYMNLKI